MLVDIGLYFGLCLYYIYINYGGPGGITSSPPLPISAPPYKYPASHAHHLPLIGHGRAGVGGLGHSPV